MDGVYELNAVFDTNQQNAKEGHGTRNNLYWQIKSIFKLTGTLCYKIWASERRKHTSAPILTISDISFQILLSSSSSLGTNDAIHFRPKCAYWHGTECFPPIIHQFNAECDPACEYLTAVHASLICILLTHTLSHTICISLFFPLLPFLSVHRQISGISPGGCSSSKAKVKRAFSFSFLFSFLCPFHHLIA